jgi:hypothetical protein
MKEEHIVILNGIDQTLGCSSYFNQTFHLTLCFWSRYFSSSGVQSCEYRTEKYHWHACRLREDRKYSRIRRTLGQVFKVHVVYFFQNSAGDTWVFNFGQSITIDVPKSRLRYIS